MAAADQTSQTAFARSSAMAPSIFIATVDHKPREKNGDAS